MSFEKIAAQETAVQALRGAIRKDRVPHALLFTGPVGAGQREAALEFAKALLCSEPKENGGCDVCQDCRMVQSGIHPDFVVVEPAEENKRVIKVEPIRELIARAGLGAFRSKRKVFVIDPAEAMNEISQNALLKTLEEPPGNSVLVLITHSPESLLATIRSRVQALNFIPVEGTLVEPETEKLKNQILEFVLRGDFSPGLSPDFSKTERHALAKALDQVILNFRGAFMIQVGAGELAGIEASENALIERSLSERFFTEELTERIEFLGQAKENLLRSFNVRLTMSALWDEFARV